jgi:hypothetical protein
MGIEVVKKVVDKRKERCQAGNLGREGKRDGKNVGGRGGKLQIKPNNGRNASTSLLPNCRRMELINWTSFCE